MRIEIRGCNILPDESDTEEGVFVFETRSDWSVRFTTSGATEPEYLISATLEDKRALWVKCSAWPLLVKPRAANSVLLLEERPNRG